MSTVLAWPGGGGDGGPTSDMSSVESLKDRAAQRVALDLSRILSDAIEASLAEPEIAGEIVDSSVQADQIKRELLARSGELWRGARREQRQYSGVAYRWAVDQEGRDQLPQGRASGPQPSAEGSASTNDAYSETLSRDRDEAGWRLGLVLRKRILLPEIRSRLNALTAEDYSARLRVTSAPGLAQLLEPKRMVSTTATARLESLLQMQTGSIGVAGPRGIGKSTLIGSARERSGRLSILIPAPVHYDAREYLLHLFAEVCAKAGGNETERPAVHPDAGRVVSRIRVIRTVAVGSAALLAVLIGMILTGQRTTLRLPYSRDFGWHLAVALLVTGLVGWALRMLLLRTAGARPAVEGQFGHESGRQIRAMSAVGRRAGDACLAAGVAAVFARQPELLVGPPLLLLGAAVLAWSAFGLRDRYLREVGQESLTSDRDLTNDMREARLARTASDHLSEIRLQETYSAGWSTTGRLASAGKGLLGIDAGLSGSLSVARAPKTLPDLVAEFRGFAAEVAKCHGQLVIAVDEMDKIDDVEKVRTLLNDLKGIFNVPGCLFIVSLSEDALVSYERRGMPFRDVFDSAFDEIISVPYLSPEETRLLLNRRVVGIPRPFSSVIYCISGGLARDTLRYARAMVRLAAEDEARGRLAASAMAGPTEPYRDREYVGVTLSTMLELLLSRDLIGKGAAAVSTIASSGGHDSTVPHMTWIEEVSSLRVNGGALFAHAVRALELPALPDHRVMRIIGEYAAYLYLLSTIVDFFHASLDRATLIELETRTGPGGLAELGRARQLFTVSPALAWRVVDSFRTAHGMPSAGRRLFEVPVDGPAAGASTRPGRQRRYRSQTSAM